MFTEILIPARIDLTVHFLVMSEGEEGIYTGPSLNWSYIHIVAGLSHAGVVRSALALEQLMRDTRRKIHCLRIDWETPRLQVFLLQTKVDVFSPDRPLIFSVRVVCAGVAEVSTDHERGQ